MNRRGSPKSLQLKPNQTGLWCKFYNSAEKPGPLNCQLPRPLCFSFEIGFPSWKCSVMLCFNLLVIISILNGSRISEESCCWVSLWGFSWKHSESRQNLPLVTQIEWGPGECWSCLLAFAPCYCVHPWCYFWHWSHLSGRPEPSLLSCLTWTED